MPDLAAFASALTAHARSRVVVELTTVYPMRWMAPYWEALQGLSQPKRPGMEDALEVLASLGLDVREQRWSRPYQMIGENGPDSLARVARRLCLQLSRYDELRTLLVAIPPPPHRDVVTLWWDTGG